MSSIVWIPRSDATVHGNNPILAIYACAYDRLPIDPAKSGSGDPMTNHWTLFCAIDTDKSIRLDPSPSGPNMAMVLMAAYKRYEYTDAAAKVVKLNTSDLTVQGFLDLLIAAKYDRYQFSASGQGCRYWTSSVIKLLSAEGKLFDKTEVASALETLRHVWDDDGTLAPAAEQTDLDRGSRTDGDQRGNALRKHWGIPGTRELADISSRTAGDGPRNLLEMECLTHGSTGTYLDMSHPTTDVMGQRPKSS
nr:hypothetical protein CFP56_23953 [Quercus suber]